MRKLLLPLLAIALILPLPAHAVKIHLLGAGNYSDPKTAGIADYSPKIGIGGGLGFESMLNRFVGVELDILGLKRKYQQDNALTTTTVTQTMIELPVLLQAHFGDFLSLGFGAYYGRYVGKVNTETLTKGTSVTNSEETFYGGSRYTQDDFGLASSFGLHLPLYPLTKLVLEGRYTLGLMDNDKNPGMEQKFNDIQALIGLSFGM